MVRDLKFMPPQQPTTGSQGRASHSVRAVFARFEHGALGEARSTFVLLLLLLTTLSARATNVGGTIGSDTLWSTGGSPYILTNSLTVSSNVTLTIDPGVIVQFTNSNILNVRGRVLAEGNASNRIVFRRPPGAGTKSGRLNITTNGMEQVRLSYVDFDGLGTGSQIINVDTAALYLDHAWFTNISVQYLTQIGRAHV